MVRRIGLFLIALNVMACGRCMGGSGGQFGPQPPNLPPLRGETPSNGIESARSVRQNGCADEGESRSVMIRRDGCFRTRSESSDGAVTTQTACTGCVEESRVRPFFTRLAEAVGEDLDVADPRQDRSTPIDDCWRAHVTVRFGDGSELDGPGIEAVRLFDDLPELGQGECDSFEL